MNSYVKYLIYLLFVTCLLTLLSEFKVHQFLTTYTGSYLNKSPRIFCIVKTHPNNIKSGKAKNTHNVWVHKCDDYRFISLLPDDLKPIGWKFRNQDDEIEVDKPFRMIQPRFHKKETHEKLTDKVYYAIISIYNRFADYDWYYLVDDDAYCNLNNMRNFLRGHNPSRAITFGFDFKTIVKGGYHSGGPGYVISREAFNRLGRKLNEDYKFCKNTGTDDVDVNDCLRELGAVMEKSVDEKERQRFLCLDLRSHFDYSIPDWLFQYSKYTLKKGYDCCADDLIAVHYMSPRDIARLDVAIETQNNILKLYDKYIKHGKKVTFKYIYDNYLSLQNFESEFLSVKK